MKMLASRSRGRIFNKAIATVVSVAFLFNFSLTNLALHHSPLRGSGTGQAWAENGPGAILSGSSMVGGGSGPGQLDLNKVQLPTSLGYIKETFFQETGKPVVIYIQDAHCNYSCQKSIEGILGYFNKEYGVNLATVEGGAGNYDLSIFTSVPDMDLREKITDYFVRQGRVTGVELFAALNPERITIKGLEDAELYDKNLNVYRESLSFKDNVNKFLNILSHFVDNLKKHIFSKKLKEFDEKKVSYEENKSKLKDYVIYLDKTREENRIKIEQFKNLLNLIDMIKEEERINFKRAEKEREKVLDELADKLSKREMADLVEQSVAFKDDNLSASDFHDYLFKKAASCNIDVNEYPNLVKYKSYLDTYDKIEKEVFFEEIFDAEHYMAESIFKNDDERRLFYLSDDLNVLDKLFSTSLTRRLYDYYQNKQDEIKTDKFVNFIEEKAQWYNMPADINPDVKNLDDYKNKMGMFYYYSFERDNVFINNINKYRGDSKALFLVTGGFHSENMTRLLKENGYSYILITPKLRSEKDNPYFHLLAGSLTPMESILSEYTAALALKSPNSEMGDPNVGRDIAIQVGLFREFIPKAAGLGWKLSMPYRLPDGRFLTLSLLSKEELARIPGMPSLEEVVQVDRKNEKGETIEGTGEIEIEMGEPQPLYALVHAEEEIFVNRLVPEESRDVIRQAEAAAVAIAAARKGVSAELEVRDAAATLRTGTRNVVYIPQIGYETQAALANEGASLERKIRDDYGSDVEIERFQAGTANDMENFEKGLNGVIDRYLSEEVLLQIINDGIPAGSLHVDIFAPGQTGINTALGLIKSRLQDMGIPEADLNSAIEKIKTRVHIINMEIPRGPKLHINEARHVIFALAANNLSRYKNNEYGVSEPDVIRRLEDIAVNVLKTIVSPDEIINATVLYNIINGLVPLRSLGVAETVQQLRQQYEAIIRSL